MIVGPRSPPLAGRLLVLDQLATPAALSGLEREPCAVCALWQDVTGSDAGLVPASPTPARG
eukprot:3489513-Pyramimonas_sp.AAC.1